MDRRRTAVALVAVALITAAAHTTVFVRLLRARGGDVSRFVVAGGPGVDAARVPPGLTVIPGIGGYDGALFYRLALNPFTRETTAHGITLDNPPYRQQRIGYPLIVWLASLGGRPLLVPWMLVTVNLVAVTAVAVLGGVLCLQHGRSVFLGLLFPFFPGFLWSLSRDLSEITACCLALGGIVAIVGRRSLTAAVLLSLAVLTRETMLIVPVALAGVWAFDRLRRGRGEFAALPFIVPVAVYVTGQLILAAVWGEFPLLTGGPGLTIPFQEFASALAYSWPRRVQLQRLYFVQCVFLALITALALFVAVRCRPARPWVLAWAATVMIAAVVDPGDWVADIVFLRILCDLHLLSTVVIVTAGPRWARVAALVATLALWQHMARTVIALG
jgi:hypothetical protein